MPIKKKDVRAKKLRERAPRKKIADLLPKIEPLPGAVCAQMVRCGKANCKCAKGKLHGPYFYRFSYVGGRLMKNYVKKADVLTVKLAVEIYRRQRKEQREGWRQALRTLRMFRYNLLDLLR